MDAARIRVGRSHEELAQRLREELAPGDSVLLKGSRSMRMERVADSLEAGERA
jgi:UDP-N-acetylmuramyl pentapeptide synthase